MEQSTAGKIIAIWIRHQNAHTKTEARPAVSILTSSKTACGKRKHLWVGSTLSPKLWAYVPHWKKKKKKIIFSKFIFGCLRLPWTFSSYIFYQMGPQSVRKWEWQEEVGKSFWLDTNLIPSFSLLTLAEATVDHSLKQSWECKVKRAQTERTQFSATAWHWLRHTLAILELCNYSTSRSDYWGRAWHVGDDYL